MSSAKEQLQVAVELFWQAAQLRPDFARGYLGLARALRLSFGDAREALLKGLERCPDDVELRRELEKLPEAVAEPEAVVEVALTWRPKVLKPKLLMLMGAAA